MRARCHVHPFRRASALSAAAVRLPCVADMSENPDPHAQELVLRPAALLNFRFDPIRHWHIDKASLMLHLSSGETAGTIGYGSRSGAMVREATVHRVAVTRF